MASIKIHYALLTVRRQNKCCLFSNKHNEMVSAKIHYALLTVGQGNCRKQARAAAYICATSLWITTNGHRKAFTSSTTDAESCQYQPVLSPVNFHITWHTILFSPRYQQLYSQVYQLQIIGKITDYITIMSYKACFN